VDLNWFTGSEEELINQFINPVPETTLTSDLFENTAKQAYSDSNTVNEFTDRSDYQEEGQYHNSRISNSDELNLPEAKYSNQEENWIRSYFFNK
jgi:hypothetical protein